MKKENVFIYCKISADTFSNEMFGETVTGDEVYNFLMRDGNHIYDMDGNTTPGDSNIWYLGCNAKFGTLRYKNYTITWSFGESSFDNVQKFVDIMADDNFITISQYRKLNEKIKEGRIIDNMYHIEDYIKAKKKGKKYKSPSYSKGFRESMKRLVGTTQKYFRGSNV